MGRLSWSVWAVFFGPMGWGRDSDDVFFSGSYPIYANQLEYFEGSTDRQSETARVWERTECPTSPGFLRRRKPSLYLLCQLLLNGEQRRAPSARPIIGYILPPQLPLPTYDMKRHETNWTNHHVVSLVDHLLATWIFQIPSK